MVSAFTFYQKRPINYAFLLCRLPVASSHSARVDICFSRRTELHKRDDSCSQSRTKRSRPDWSRCFRNAEWLTVDSSPVSAPFVSLVLYRWKLLTSHDDYLGTAKSLAEQRMWSVMLLVTKQACIRSSLWLVWIALGERRMFRRLWLGVLTAVNMKLAVFWFAAPCRLVWVCQCFRGMYYLHHQGDEWHPDDWGSADLWNVGKLIPVYTALQTRRQPTSFTRLFGCYKELC
jgi:hypothetical protein